MHESATFPCPRCGAALPVDPTAPTVTCVYCRNAVAVPRAIRDPALAHAARMGAVQVHAAQAQQALGVYRASAAYQKEWWKPVLVLLVSVFGFSFVASVLAPVLDPRALSILGPVMIYGPMLFFGYRYYRAYQRSKEQGGAPLAVAASICSRCGGPLVFEADRAVCHACNAVAVAGRTIQGELVATAERRVRQLEVERARAERQMYRSSSGVQTFSRIYLLAVLIGPVVLLVGILLVAGTANVVNGAMNGRARELRDGLMLIVVGSVFGAALAGIAALVHAMVLGPARAGEDAMRAIAARLGGRVVRGGTTTALDWLDGHWWGPAPFELMMGQQEIVRATLETAIAGLPALVVMVATGPMRFTGNKLHVLVAAPKARGGSAAAAAELAQFGFEMKVSEDGVALARAEASADVMTEAVLGRVLTEAAVLAGA